MGGGARQQIVLLCIFSFRSKTGDPVFDHAKFGAYLSTMNACSMKDKDYLILSGKGTKGKVAECFLYLYS